MRTSFASALALALAFASPTFAETSAARADRVHRATLVLDPHVDLPAPYDWTASGPPADAADQASLDQLAAGGVDAVAFSVFVPQGPRTPERIAAARAEAEAKLASIQSLAAANPQRVGLARSSADARAIAASGRTAVLVSVLNAYPLSGDPNALSEFHRRGVSIVGLTHAGNNDFADSSRPQPRDKPAEHGGLSPSGRALIAEANRLGVLVDVSQLSQQATLQAIALSRAPVIASHSGVKGRVDSPRNLSDAELDALAAKGGVIAIVAFSSYLRAVPEETQRKIREIRARYGAVNGYEGLSRAQREAMSAETRALTPRATVKDFVDSIDYAVGRIGVDHVAISTDFNHGGGVEGFANASEAPNVTAELLRRGYSEADIRKLWGENVLRVLDAAQSSSAATLAAAGTPASSR